MADTTASDTTMSSTTTTPAPSNKSKSNKHARTPITDADLDIWSTIKDAQNSNGLRYADYQRYRQYCTRRLHRTRVSTHLQHPRKQYKYRDVTDDDVYDVKVLTIPLFQAERSWAYSCEIRDELTADNERTKYHMRARLHKAAQYSVRLQTLVDAHCNSLTQLQTLVYTTWMLGLDYTEMRLYTTALEHFNASLSTAQSIRPYVSANVQAILDEKVQQLNNLIRVVTYNKQQYGDNDAVAQSRHHTYKIDNADLRLQQLRGTVTTKTENGDGADGAVQFAGKNVAVTNSNVRDALATADKQIKSVSVSSATDADAYKTQITAVKAALSSYDAALKQTRTDITTTKSDATKQTLTLLQSHVLHLKHEATMLRLAVQLQSLTHRYSQQQALAMLSHNKHKQKCNVRALDIVQLYDKQISVSKQLADIGTSTKHVDLLAYAAAMQSAFTAMRCFFVAAAYANRKQYPEAYALYSKCDQRIQQATPQLTNLSTSKLTDQQSSSVNQVQQVLKQAQADISVQQRIVSALHSIAADTDQSDVDGAAMTKHQRRHRAHRGIMDRLHEYNAGTDEVTCNIVPDVPALQLVPNKPILFDIAFNGIDWPAPYAASNGTDEQQTASGGADETDAHKGLLGRLFGR